MAEIKTVSDAIEWLRDAQKRLIDVEIVLEVTADRSIQRVAQLEKALRQASLELKEAANVLTAYVPRTAEIFKKASAQAYEVARNPRETHTEGEADAGNRQ
jgi:hypothetical protein